MSPLEKYPLVQRHSNLEASSKKRREDSPHSNSASREILRESSSVSLSFWSAHASSRRFQIASDPSQGKSVIRRFPQAQPDKLLIYAIIDLWPKRADDVFSS